MKKLFIWLAGFFEDQKGSASSKRGTLYICLFFLWRILESNLNGKALVDNNILYFVTGIILFCIGAVTAEFFSPTVSKITTEVKKEETQTVTQ